MSNPSRTPGRKLKRWIDDQGLTQREMAVARGERPDPLKWRLQYVSIVNPIGGGMSARKAG